MIYPQHNKPLAYSSSPPIWYWRKLLHRVNIQSYPLNRITSNLGPRKYSIQNSSYLMRYFVHKDTHRHTVTLTGTSQKWSVTKLGRGLMTQEEPWTIPWHMYPMVQSNFRFEHMQTDLIGELNCIHHWPDVANGWPHILYGIMTNALYLLAPCREYVNLPYSNIKHRAGLY